MSTPILSTKERKTAFGKDMKALLDKHSVELEVAVNYNGFFNGHFIRVKFTDIYDRESKEKPNFPFGAALQTCLEEATQS